MSASVRSATTANCSGGAHYPNADLPKNGAEKLEIVIVVDKLLTGFDSKYLNTL